MIIPIKPWLDLANGAGGMGLSARPGSLPLGLALSSSAESEDYLRSGGYCPFGNSMGIMNDRMEFYHEPILSARILEAMEPVAGKQIFDGTLGGGGHAEMFLRSGAHVIGCDQDGAALEHARKRLARFGDQFLPVRGNFSAMDGLLAQLGIDQVDGILLDLGVSSRQLDDPSRGFSFRESGPLDMRMDDRAEFSARELVNEWAEAELARIFRDYGEEKRAYRAAREIVRARSLKPIETTGELAEVVARAIPKTSAKNPSTRVFQAIRIAVNRELEVLETALAKSIPLLSKGGVLAVITFHSLEDRIVKQFLRNTSMPYIDRPEWPEPRENPDYHFHLPVRRAIAPEAAEIASNPRARSAKLRLAVKV